MGVRHRQQFCGRRGVGHVGILFGASPTDAGTSLESVSATINSPPSNLLPGQTYFVRLKATNSAGTSVGTTTSFEVPMVSTATGVGAATSTSLTLAGTAAATAGLGSNVQLSFNIGTSTNYGTSVPATLTNANPDWPNEVTATATGLTPGTTYDYQLVATGTSGQAVGENVSYTTAADTLPQTTTGSASSLSPAVAGGSGSATLTGTVNPEGSPGGFVAATRA
jgi:phosphodiesterase/alkaline phosphatase D-like protein